MEGNLPGFLPRATRMSNKFKTSYHIGLYLIKKLHFLIQVVSLSDSKNRKS